MNSVRIRPSALFAAPRQAAAAAVAATGAGVTPITPLTFSVASSSAFSPSSAFASPRFSSLATRTTMAAAATTSFQQSPFICRRFAHSHSKEAEAASPIPRVPEPIPLVPDVETLLLVIGRNMKQHASKFPSWEALFTLSSDQLKELGIEPPRDRRYLLRWLQRFREGKFGVGGDFAYVLEGAAYLRVVTELRQGSPPQIIKRVVNVDPEYPVDMVHVRGYKAIGARTVAGPFAIPIKKDEGGGVKVKVVEGMWELKRGRKIDGGERRQAEVRFKRRVAERRALREQQMMG